MEMIKEKTREEIEADETRPLHPFCNTAELVRLKDLRLKREAAVAEFASTMRILMKPRKK